MNIIVIIALIIIILILFFIYNEAVTVKILLRHLVSVADPDFSSTEDAKQVDNAVSPDDPEK